jgi:UDP-N-acetylmuramoylalanine--D-glutamate ligase
MIETSYAGKEVLVVGAARSGIATAAFLLSQGATVVLTDRRPAAELSAAIGPLRLGPSGTRLLTEFGGHRAASFRECDLVVVSPGVPLSLDYFAGSRAAGIPVIAEVELAYRHIRGRILGITGSNGKTTTTELVAEMLHAGGLRGHAAGNVGVPLVSFVAGSTDEDFYATELSSFQLEGIDRFRPAVGTMLNLTPDHLDRYDGLEDYAAAKRRIFMNQQPGDFAVLNFDDPQVAALAAGLASTAVFFSRQGKPQRGTYVDGRRILHRDGTSEKELFLVSDIILRGEHNLENVLAAATVCLLAGVPAESLRDTVRRFKGVEHRLEWVAEIDGVQYFNDSKATNVDATIKAIRAFPSGIHLIAGGRDKGADFSLLRSLVRERVRELVLIGEAAGTIERALIGQTDIRRASSLEEAVELCRRQATAGEIVLLAPACASYDMFENYEHRGRVFKKAVLASMPGN